MFLEARWAEYARIQAIAKLSSSIAQSDADDVRLDRLIEGLSLGAAEVTANLDRAVRSHRRKQRSRQAARKLTGHALMPAVSSNPEEVLIWRQSWARFEHTFSSLELRLLLQSDTVPKAMSMTGAERTRLSRIKSSAAYRTARAAIFARPGL